MKEILPKKYRHLLWKDELGDDFILLKYAEVYKYSKSVLRLCIWSSQKRFWLRERGLILEEMPLSEGLYILDVKIENLPLLIALGAFRKRPHLKGRWLEEKERLLAHKIIPYKPVSLKAKNRAVTRKKLAKKGISDERHSYTREKAVNLETMHHSALFRAKKGIVEGYLTLFPKKQKGKVCCGK